jgi:hypothetical protein
MLSFSAAIVFFFVAPAALATFADVSTNLFATNIVGISGDANFTQAGSTIEASSNGTFSLNGYSAPCSDRLFFFDSIRFIEVLPTSIPSWDSRWAVANVPLQVTTVSQTTSFEIKFGAPGFYVTTGVLAGSDSVLNLPQTNIPVLPRAEFEALDGSGNYSFMSGTNFYIQFSFDATESDPTTHTSISSLPYTITFDSVVTTFSDTGGSANPEVWHVSATEYTRCALFFYLF